MLQGKCLDVTHRASAYALAFSELGGIGRRSWRGVGRIGCRVVRIDRSAIEA